VSRIIWMAPYHWHPKIHSVQNNCWRKRKFYSNHFCKFRENFSFNNNFSRHIKQFGLKCQTLCLIWTYMAGLYVRICVRNMRTYTCASVYVMYAFTHLITGKTKNTLDHSLLLRSEWKDEEILISETFHDFSNYWKLF